MLQKFFDKMEIEVIPTFSKSTQPLNYHQLLVIYHSKEFNRNSLIIAENSGTLKYMYKYMYIHDKFNII